MRKRAKVYVLPGKFDERHGYCAKVVSHDDYEDLLGEIDELRAQVTALQSAITKRGNNTKAQIVATAKILAEAFGVELKL